MEAEGLSERVRQGSFPEILQGRRAGSHAAALPFTQPHFFEAGRCRQVVSKRPTREGGNQSGSECVTAGYYPQKAPAESTKGDGTLGKIVV